MVQHFAPLDVPFAAIDQDRERPLSLILALPRFPEFIPERVHRFQVTLGNVACAIPLRAERHDLALQSLEDALLRLGQRYSGCQFLRCGQIASGPFPRTFVGGIYAGSSFRRQYDQLRLRRFRLHVLGCGIAVRA